MNHVDAFNELCLMRWPATGGAPVCSHCGCEEAYRMTKSPNRMMFKCKLCRKFFTPISGTSFHQCKIPTDKLLAMMNAFRRGANRRQVAIRFGVIWKTADLVVNRMKEFPPHTSSSMVPEPSAS